MKRCIIDLSINRRNPYCGIASDTAKNYQYLKAALKKEFIFEEFCLSPKFKLMHLLNIFSGKPTSFQNIDNANFLLNRIKGALGFKTKINTRGVDLFYCPTVNNYRLSNSTTKLVRIHDLFPLTHPWASPYARIVSFKRSLAFNVKEPNCYFICNSVSTEKQFLKFFPMVKDRCYVVPCGASIDIHNATPPDEIPAKFSLIIAALEPKKNLENFLLGWEKAIKKSADVIPLILVANEGWKNTRIKKILSEIKLKYPNRIIHLKSVKNSNLTWLLKNCQYFIMPSIMEGFGIPVLNALQMKKPMIISDLEVFHEVAGNAALYFDPYSQDKISDAILEINDNLKLQKKLSEAASVRRELYSDKSLKQQWKKVIEDIINIKK